MLFSRTTRRKTMDTKSKLVTAVVDEVLYEYDGMPCLITLNSGDTRFILLEIHCGGGCLSE